MTLILFMQKDLDLQTFTFYEFLIQKICNNITPTISIVYITILSINTKSGCQDMKPSLHHLRKRLVQRFLFMFLT